MLFDDTPNTLGYMLAGYVFLFGLPCAYVLGWLVRQRNLEKDVDLLETLSHDDERQRPAQGGGGAPESRAAGDAASGGRSGVRVDR